MADTSKAAAAQAAQGMGYAENAHDPNRVEHFAGYAVNDWQRPGMPQMDPYQAIQYAPGVQNNPAAAHLFPQGTPGTSASIPQGGWADPGLQAYLQGTNPAQVSYERGLTVPGSSVQINPVAPAPAPAPAPTPVPTPVNESNTPAVIPVVNNNNNVNPNADSNDGTNHLTQDEFDELEQIIGGDDYDANTDVLFKKDVDDFRLTPEQDLAADTLYNHNAQVVGPAQGANDTTSLYTGGPSGINKVSTTDNVAAGIDKIGLGNPLTDALLGVVRDDNRATTKGTTALEHAINKDTKNYQDAVAAGEVPAFDASDQSTWRDIYGNNSDGSTFQMGITEADKAKEAEKPQEQYESR